MMVPALLSTKLAAEYLSIGEDGLRKLVASGKLKPVQIPGEVKSLKFKREDLDAFAAGLPYVASSKHVRERKERVQKQIGNIGRGV